MQTDVNQVKAGTAVEMEGDIYLVTSREHVKPGKGGAFVRMKLKNIRLGNSLDRTIRSGEKLEVVYVEKKNLQYLYSAKDIYEFMDRDTYEQVALHREQVGEVLNYLKENLEVTAIAYENKILALEPPIFIDMKIASTEPGIRGDTSRSGTKPATTESGLVIQVPLFINGGDMVRIDTRTKEYVNRV